MRQTIGDDPLLIARRKGAASEEAAP